MTDLEAAENPELVDELLGAGDLADLQRLAGLLQQARIQAEQGDPDPAFQTLLIVPGAAETLTGANPDGALPCIAPPPDEGGN